MAHSEGWIVRSQNNASIAGFLTLTVALVLGGILCYSWFEKATRAAPAVSEDQVNEAGGIAIFARGGSVTEADLSFGSTAAPAPTDSPSSASAYNYDALADLANKSMSASLTIGTSGSSLSNPNAAEDEDVQRVQVLLVLWGDARLESDSIWSSGANLRVSNPQIVDDDATGAGLGCGVNAFPELGLTPVGASPPLQVLNFDLRLGPTVGVYAPAIRFGGTRLGNGAVFSGADTAVALPAIAPSFPINILGVSADSRYPNRCSSPTLVVAVGPERYERQDFYSSPIQYAELSVNAGILAPSQDFLTVSPLLADPRALRWSQNSEPATSFYVDLALDPYLVIRDRVIDKQEDTYLFLAGALIGIIGGGLLEWFRLLVKSYRPLATMCSLVLVSVLMSGTIMITMVSTSWHRRRRGSRPFTDRDGRR